MHNRTPMTVVWLLTLVVVYSFCLYV